MAERTHGAVESGIVTVTVRVSRFHPETDRSSGQQDYLVPAGPGVAVEPLPNYPVVRDVVPDLEPMVTHHTAVRPFIVRGGEEQEHPTAEYLQTPIELDAYLQFSYCIRCGIC